MSSDEQRDIRFVAENFYRNAQRPPTTVMAPGRYEICKYISISIGLLFINLGKQN